MCSMFPAPTGHPSGHRGYSAWTSSSEWNTAHNLPSLSRYMPFTVTQSGDGCGFINRRVTVFRPSRMARTILYEIESATCSFLLRDGPPGHTLRCQFLTERLAGEAPAASSGIPLDNAADQFRLSLHPEPHHCQLLVPVGALLSGDPFQRHPTFRWRSRYRSQILRQPQQIITGTVQLLCDLVQPVKSHRVQFIPIKIPVPKNTPAAIRPAVPSR